MTFHEEVVARRAKARESRLKAAERKYDAVLAEIKTRIGEEADRGGSHAVLLLMGRRCVITLMDRLKADLEGFKIVTSRTHLHIDW